MNRRPQGRVRHGKEPSAAALAMAGYDIHEDIALVFAGRLTFFSAITPTARPSHATGSASAHP